MNSLNSVALITMLVVPHRPYLSGEEQVLIKVQPKTGSPIVGELLKETDLDFFVLDLRTGKQVTLNKRDILRSSTNIADKDAIAVVGLPSFMAWRMKDLLGSQKLIATLPLVNADGDETESGRKLSEELTTGLVGHGIRLVERSLLTKALDELKLQQTELFDPQMAQKVGKQVGAYAILCGTIVNDRQLSQAHVRLIEVETGEILFAGQQTLSGRSAPLKNRLNGSIFVAPNLMQYWIDRGHRRHIEGPAVSDQLFHRNRQVSKDQDTINSIAEGKKLTLANRLVRSSGDGQLYFLDDGKKRLITEKALKIHPFNTAKVTPITPKELAAIPDGPSLD